MLDLAGAPLVGRILERVKRCNRFDQIILAIPDTAKDAILQQVGSSYGVTVFAGSENDVLDRYYRAALAAGADVVGRLPADNATPEPAEIDRIVDHHLGLGRRGFSSNLSVIYNSGYPDGIGAEIFDFSLLAEARDRRPTPRQIEHVHLNFFDYTIQRGVDENWCPISTVMCPAEFRRPDLVLDVNTQSQYEFMRRLYLDLYPENPNFHITDIIRWYDQLQGATMKREVQ
jgi:spore coat polysaccharide biosynthesis protein SpsF (cytidylyltransferase family)